MFSESVITSSERLQETNKQLRQKYLEGDKYEVVAWITKSKPGDLKKITIWYNKKHNSADASFCDVE